MTRQLKVLVGCEFSGVVRDAFRDLGHDAWSCDLQPCERSNEFHYRCDAIMAIRWDNWDLMVAHPPCDHLSLSGARWCADHWVACKKHPAGKYWHDGSAKRSAREQSASFFRQLWEAPIKHICLENPMSMASTLVAPKNQTIHPWEFGHPEQKTTWLWLKNLPHLVPTNNVRDEMMKLPKNVREKVWSVPPGETRKNDRSRSYEGIAKAMSEQWSRHILNNLTP